MVEIHGIGERFCWLAGLIGSDYGLRLCVSLDVQRVWTVEELSLLEGAPSVRLNGMSTTLINGN
jgi:hypothetical protein